MLELIERWRTAERMIAEGVTYAELAERLRISDKTARRLVSDLRRLGAEIKESQVNNKGMVRLKLVKSKRVFH